MRTLYYAELRCSVLLYISCARTRKIIRVPVINSKNKVFAIVKGITFWHCCGQWSALCIVFYDTYVLDLFFRAFYVEFSVKTTISPRFGSFSILTEVLEIHFFTFFRLFEKNIYFCVMNIHLEISMDFVT